MEQSPPWEGNRTSATQEIPRILWNPKDHYRIHNSPPPVAILRRSIQSMPHPTSRRSILILSYHLRLGLLSGLPTSGFPTKTLYLPLSSPHVLLAPPISVFLILSPELYLVRSTEHEAPRYVVFSTPLLPRPSYVQIFSSALYSRKPSAYIPPSGERPNFTPI